MYPWIRSLRLAVQAQWAERLGPLDQSVIRLRVWPQDIDLNLHLNNGRYLSLMDMGRNDLAIRNGLMRLGIRKRWMPLVGAAHIVFLRSIALGRAFDLCTRVIAWDHKWIFMEQRFEKDGEPVALAVVKVVFRKGGKNIPPDQVAQGLAPGLTSPPVPDYIRRWLEASEAQRHQSI